jgi:hypothetical protein
MDIEYSIDNTKIHGDKKFVLRLSLLIPSLLCKKTTVGAGAPTWSTLSQQNARIK